MKTTVRENLYKALAVLLVVLVFACSSCTVSDEDKKTVARARKLQRFLTQPFTVAETFTGQTGMVVALKDTIKGCAGVPLRYTVVDLPP